jgi:short-subunit dehydrogenase
MQVQGAVCLVVGGSGGIGRAVARALATAGARVVVSGRSEASLAAVTGETGGHYLVADLAADGAAEQLAATAEAEHGRVDVLVNAAGIGYAGALTEMPPSRAEELLALDLAAPIRLTRALLPAMLARGRGRVAHIASIVGYAPSFDETAYAAAKAGLVGFCRALGQELADTGVGVSVVAPGAVDTDFFARRGAPYARRWPRPITPERVGRAAVEAITHERAETFVPAWLRFPARFAGVWPQAYRALAARLA